MGCGARNISRLRRRSSCDLLRRRSEQAMENYVGNLETLKGVIDLACRIVKDAEQRDSRNHPR